MIIDVFFANSQYEVIQTMARCNLPECLGHRYNPTSYTPYKCYLHIHASTHSTCYIYVIVCTMSFNMFKKLLENSLNATDAGLGMFLTYATFMKRSQGAVKLGTITPLFNNIVSLLCGIMMFCTVFSVQRELGQTKNQIVDTLQYNGPGNSGLTFIW